MIIWLASYPRSGNTLLRTVLKQTMDLGSYSDEPLRAGLGLTNEATGSFGHLEMNEAWPKFYATATRSERIHLVKTHLPPRDGQPFIYVVRDGRQSLLSYDSYHRRFFPEHSGTLMNLVLGDDYYGGWSEHHTAWFSGTAPSMLVRYEDLVEPSPAVLEEIARFIRHIGDVRTWSNPFEKLHHENPGFFRQGEVVWKGAPDWSSFLNGVFFRLHGHLMLELGYATDQDIADAEKALDPELGSFVGVAKSLQERKRNFERVCGERLAVIEVLDAEIKRLGSLKHC